MVEVVETKHTATERLILCTVESVRSRLREIERAIEEGMNVPLPVSGTLDLSEQELALLIWRRHFEAAARRNNEKKEI